MHNTRGKNSVAHTHTKIPEPEVRRNVADVLLGRGLTRPSEQKQMLSVRAFESDTLEGEGRPRMSFPARALDFVAVEHAVAEDPAVVFPAGPASLSCVSSDDIVSNPPGISSHQPHGGILHLGMGPGQYR